MKQFLCECKKAKGKLLTILIPVLGIISVWCLWVMHDPDEEYARQGYTYMVTTLLVINSIFLPVTVAVMASRLMDLENKGNTYKLLCTVQSKSSIFVCKLLLSVLHLIGFFLAETAIVYALGQIEGITEAFSPTDYLRLQGVGLLTCILLTILQMFFSLRLENQLYPLFIGLLGSFLGLFSMFFPAGSSFMYLCPWSYFTLGGSYLMLWDEVSRTTTFVRVAFNIPGFAVLLAVLLLSYVLVRRYFLRKEV